MIRFLVAGQVIWASYVFFQRRLIADRLHVAKSRRKNRGVQLPFLRLFDERRKRIAAERSMSFCIELFVIALDNGMNVRLAIQAVSQYVDGELRRGLQTVVARMESGARLQDALEDLGKHFPVFRELSSTLIAAERYGAPISVVLERLAAYSRETQERCAERAAKRLSVQLLFPLAGLTLPAFALLTFAPVIADALAALAPLSH